MRLEFRAQEQHYFDEVVEKVVQCARGAALATGCELEYHHYEPTCAGVLHNETLLAEYRSLLQEFGIEEEEYNMNGSTDVGNVSQIIPTIHPLLRICAERCSLHTPEFLNATIQPMALDRMLLGSKLLALIALRVLADAEFAAKAKSEIPDA